MRARLVVLLLLSVSFSAVTILPETASASTLYVGGAGPGRYESIQDAVEDANPGDRIVVLDGVYLEHVWIEKALTLVGQGSEKTTISHDFGDFVVTILASDVTFRGFSIINGDEHGSGIQVRSAQDCVVSDNYVYSEFIGIHVSFSTSVSVTNNVVDGKDIAVHIYGSDNVTVSRNEIDNSETGIIIWSYTNYSSVVRNSLTDNEFAIRLLRGSHNVVSDNLVQDNHEGIRLDYAHDNIIARNTVSGNTKGILLFSSEGNRVYHNNIMNNSWQAGDDYGTNAWDNGYPSGGNYWSDYEGHDEKKGAAQNEYGSDGIGDTAFGVGLTIDRYPLMHPYAEEESLLGQTWFWIAVISVAVLIPVALALNWRRKEPHQEEPPA